MCCSQPQQEEGYPIDNGIHMITNQEGGGVVLIAVCGEGMTNNPLRRRSSLFGAIISTRPEQPSVCQSLSQSVDIKGRCAL